MKGVSKISNKLGPVGMIGLAIAMPYALSGLSAGTTGLSGATLTHYYGGPTYALKMTTRTYNEISSKVPPDSFDEENNVFIYNINKYNIFWAMELAALFSVLMEKGTFPEL